MSDFFKESDFVDCLNSLTGEPGITWVTNKANRLLRELGTVVYARENKSISLTYNGMVVDCWTSVKDEYDEYAALLINIEPIERDSAEKLIEDLIAWDKSSHSHTHTIGELIDRAKRLRGGK